VASAGPYANHLHLAPRQITMSAPRAITVLKIVVIKMRNFSAAVWSEAVCSIVHCALFWFFMSVLTRNMTNYKQAHNQTSERRVHETPPLPSLPCPFSPSIPFPYPYASRPSLLLSLTSFHASTSSLNFFLRAGCCSWRPTNSVKALPFYNETY